MEKEKPELMAPAGDWSSLNTAVNYGADSVYFGVKTLNMRANAKNFELNQLDKIIEFLHNQNKRGYLTLNTIIMNSEIEKLNKVIDIAKKADIDGIIAWDMAVISKARRKNIEVHLSTQASVSNIDAIEFYCNLGVKRIVLARECNLEQIKRIVELMKEKNINCKIETFIHGAMCVSMSGRCFLSLDAFEKSANRGECKQPCRREFYIHDIKNESEYILGKDYILSPKDLCTVEFIDKLIEAGIHAFKIEGRMRAPEYIKETVSAYRKAIDAYFEGNLSRRLKKHLKTKLKDVYNRGFSDGFYFGRPVDWISRRLQQRNKKVFVGEVLNYYRKISVAEIIVRSHGIKKGDYIMIEGNKTPVQFFYIKQMEQNHKRVKKVEKGESVGIKVPFKVRRKDKVFLWEESFD